MFWNDVWPCFFIKKKNKSNYPLLPNLSLPKNFFQISLNKGHPPTEGWHNVCICFIQLVVHQYKNIKKKKKKKKKWYGYIEKNKSKVWRMRIKSQNIERKKKVNEMKSNKYWMKHYSNILVWNNPHITFWAFTIIYFHTPSLSHDTSLIKSTQIKDWLLSFEGFNLEENFDLLIGLFSKKLLKKN